VPPERRRVIFEQLRAGGVGVQVNYLPAYWHPVLTDLGYPLGLCPVAEAFYSQEISLPLYPTLDFTKVNFVADAVLVAAAIR
jgi:dTDP-4-amino-4,6-dideoxygalactose transaminase